LREGGREGGREGEREGEKAIHTCEASLSLLLGRMILHSVGGLDDENIGSVLIGNFSCHQMSL